MSEQKYYVKLIQTGVAKADEGYQLYLCLDDGKYSFKSKSYEEEHVKSLERYYFTKSDLGEIMDGFIYKKFIYQFDVYIAEDLELMGFKVVDDEYDEEKQQFKNEWEWINPLIELVPVESEGE